MCNPKTDFSNSKDLGSRLFSPHTGDMAIVSRYQQCAPPPDLAPFDMYIETGEKCLARYTNPDFFITDWLEQQKKEQLRMKEKRDQRRAERKKEGPRRIPAVEEVLF